MIFTTLQDALTELMPRINGGACKPSTAIDRINQATRRIMNRPRKPVHIERVIRFFTDKDTITLPREVEKIIHYTMDTRPAPMFSKAYEFVSGGWGELGCSSCIPGKFLVDRGNHYSTMFDLPSMGCDEEKGGPKFDAFRLVAFSTAESDTQRELTIYGTNDKNETLGSPLPGMKLPINRWHGGVEGELFMDLLSFPVDRFNTSPKSVRDVERVSKDVTDGFVSLYSYDPETHQMFFLAKYHPQETNPRYRRYRITSPNYTHGTSIYALCELGYVPMTSLDDVLIIQNMDALKMMVMAIEFENEREFQAAKAYEADAYRLIEDQRSSERQHDYNLIQVSPAYGLGDVRAL